MGSLSGIFVAEPSEIEKIMGREVYFGEVLGKHSDISCSIDDENLKMVCDDPVFNEQAIKFGLVPSGINPLHYLES